MQFFNKTEAILNFLLLQGDYKLIFGFLCLYRPDFDRITILETFIIKNWRNFWKYISAFLDFYDVYNFETYINVPTLYTTYKFKMFVRPRSFQERRLCHCKMDVLMVARYFTTQHGFKGWSEGGDTSGVAHVSKGRGHMDVLGKTN